MRVLLIHPPVSKPCEPPAGIARLAGALKAKGISCQVVDANVEGLHFLLNSQRFREEYEYRGRESAPSQIDIVSPDTYETCHVRGMERAGDTWTKRAFRNLERHLRSLRSRPLYGHADRYRRAVADINRVLAAVSSRASVSLADYEGESLSPLQSADLFQAAARPEMSPYYPYFRSRLMPILKEHNPVIIGISVNYLSQALPAFALIGFIRAATPQGRIILGGGLITSWLQQSQRQEFCGADGAGDKTDSGVRTFKHIRGSNPCAGLVDDLVAGPGEDYLLSLVEKGNRQTPLKNAFFCHSGLDRESNGNLKMPDSGLHRNDGRETELEYFHGLAVPCPDYLSFPWELYLSPGAIIPYSASTGCYWRRCRFCPETAEGNPYRPLPLEKVLSDLERLKMESNPVLIHFLDNAMSPSFLTALAGQRLGVPWYGFVRITEDMTDPEFCRRLRVAGCVMLKLGLESGDQGVLDILEKGISLTTASRVLRNLKEAGIGTYVYLLFGTPAEDFAAARRTREYVVANSPWIDFLNVAIFNMPVFAAAAADLVTRPFSAGDLSLYTDFDHPRGWNRREARRFVDGELKRDPVIAGILKRTPPVFTSNHAPFYLKTSCHAFSLSNPEIPPP